MIKRNEIVHRRGNLPTPDYPALIDAWKLGAWYSELAVLRICGFNGLYRSRLSEDTWVGSVEPVPWRQAMDARRTPGLRHPAYSEPVRGPVMGPGSCVRSSRLRAISAVMPEPDPRWANISGGIGPDGRLARHGGPWSH